MHVGVITMHVACSQHAHDHKNCSYISYWIVATALVFEKAWVLSRVARRKPTPLAKDSFPIDGVAACY